MIPDWLLVISLVALLAYISVDTILKAKSQYNSERGQIVFEAVCIGTEIIDRSIQGKYNIINKTDADEENAHINANESLDINLEILSRNDSDPVTSTLESKILIESIDEGDIEQAELTANKLLKLMKEEKKTPLSKITVLILLVTVVVGLNMLKGGEGSGLLGIQCGSLPYWYLTAAELIWMCILSLLIRSYFINRWKTKQKLKYCLISGDIEWNSRNTLIYPLLSFFAGIFSGMFGIGGGIIKGPLMLQMGIHPLVAAATTAVMITFTSTAATTMFVAFGTLTWDYAAYFFFLGLISTFVGQVGLGYFINKYKRYSFITISVGFVVFISTILMGYESINSILHSPKGISNNYSLCHD